MDTIAKYLTPEELAKLLSTIEVETVVITGEAIVDEEEE